jgi:hydroxymethylpyrimidine/phosphomethylpyrimidine kinase
MANHNNNHYAPTPPILLTIAGFDPSCGAGTAADLKTFAAHGCYGVAAITSLTVQNTQGVKEVQNTPSATLRAQLDALVNDCEIAAVKIGTELLDAAGIKYMTTELFKRSSVITPNVPEAEILTGLSIKDTGDMEAAARKIVEMGARAVIVKGGHMDKAVDILFDGTDIMPLAGDKSKDELLHGTGCTFASAVAAHLSAGRSLFEAATLAKAYVTKAIEKGYPVGKGRVPLDHFYRHKIEPPARGVHEVPQHGMHPAAEPATH